ncbi:hypothetical protein U1Q18_005560 [Sarracenia purpurea var. burkii]
MRNIFVCRSRSIPIGTMGNSEDQRTGVAKTRSTIKAVVEDQVAKIGDGGHGVQATAWGENRERRIWRFSVRRRKKAQIDLAWGFDPV